MASNVVRRPDDPAIMEHDVVRLSKAIATNDGAIAKGTTGSVVYIHRRGAAFEIEFGAPFHVVTVGVGDLERIAV